MVVFKCKMCNANLNIDEGVKTVTCEFCGTTQIIEKRYPGENFVKRGYVFLEEGDFKSAKEYFGRALDENAEAYEAYLGKVMVETEIKTVEEFFDLDKITDIEEFLKNIKYSSDYKNAVRFACDEEKVKLEKYKASIYKRAYDSAYDYMQVQDYEKAMSLLKRAYEYEGAPELLEKCEALAKACELEEKYEKALEYMNKSAYKNALNLFEELDDYKDSLQLFKECDYRCGEAHMKSEDYLDAIRVFKRIIEYKDAKELLEICENIVFERRYNYAKEYLEKSGNARSVEEAKKIFAEMTEYKDCQELINVCDKELAYLEAKKGMEKRFSINEYKKSEKRFVKLANYKDSEILARQCDLRVRLISFVVIPALCIVIVGILVLVCSVIK